MPIGNDGFLNRENPSVSAFTQSIQNCRQHLTLFRESAKVWNLFKPDQFFRAHKPADLTLDALQDPSLLAWPGQLRMINQTISSLQKSQVPLPEKYTVAITVPNEQWERKLENSIRKTNQVVLSKGLTGYAKHGFLRATTGVEGKVYPVGLKKALSCPDLPAEEGRKIELELNLSGLSQGDLVKIASFTNRFIPK